MKNRGPIQDQVQLLADGMALLGAVASWQAFRAHGGDESRHAGGPSVVAWLLHLSRLSSLAVGVRFAASMSAAERLSGIEAASARRVRRLGLQISYTPGAYRAAFPL